MRVFTIAFVLMAFIMSGMAVWIDSDPDSGHIGVGAGPDGQFSIGVPPNGDYPYVRELLHSSYRHPSPEGAFFSLWVDSSVVYSNSAIIPFMFPDSASYIDGHNVVPTILDPINSWLHTEWFIVADPFGNDSIRVTQILQPIETGGSGTVVMKWIIHNQSSNTHDIGFMLYLDTKVGVSDTAIIVAPGVPPSDSSRIFPDPLHSWEVPPYWEAFEGDPTDTLDDGLVARSVLTLPPNTPPDRIAFGDIHDLLGTYWEPEVSMPRYHDSGVMAWWYPVTMPPDTTIIIQTSYGLADSTASIAGIYGMRLSFPHNLVVRGCELRPNPFSVTVGVTNNSDSTVHDLRVRIDLTESDYCTLAFGEVYDKPVTPASVAEGAMGFTFFDLEIPDPPLVTHVDHFRFEAYTTDSFSISPLFNLGMQGTDYIGPEARTIEPLWGTITSDPNQIIKMFIRDEDSSVDTMRIFFGFITAAGTLYADIRYPELSFRDDTLYFEPPEPL
ncbi:MAG TPA: hypothetical protein ENN07_08200, partial [candidate division Zixibacteria bacterium]|nr:hypothetical protein [candidate division Zixibacteria bacterium]